MQRSAKQFFSFLIFGLALTHSFARAATPDADPENIAIVDTGYDACIQSGKTNCEDNKNLLIRGGEPIPDVAPFDFQFATFREHLTSYLDKFKQTYQTRAILPTSIADLLNYRIVVINLLYDFNAGGSQSELTELENEFYHSGQTDHLAIPEQHKLYGLDESFDKSKYAFEWWPVTFANLEVTDPQFVYLNMNWPGKSGTPSHAFAPRDYKLLDFPYFITGIPYADDVESNSMDLRSLLTMMPTDGHPLLILYHCVAGKDRTGAVSAAYFMKFGGYPYLSQEIPNARAYRSGPVSLREALQYTKTDRPANPGSRKLSKAFCLMLNKPLNECSEV